MVLIGREREQERIAELIDSARRGTSAALVLRGEAGVGKTALARFAIDAADGLTVVRATGIESEAELEFSGLFEVCRPLLGHLEELPGPQAEALRVALGLAEGAVPDRFGVGAATLSLLATAAEEQPLLVVVDDAQWLDRASRDALLFAARRLMADPVAFLVTMRDEPPLDHGLREHRLSGLDAEASRALVESVVGEAVAPAVLEALHVETGGNPLALVEVPDRLTGGQLRGSEPLDGPLPVTEGIGRAFSRRLERLPERTLRALGVLAASGDDRLAPSLQALEHLELTAADLLPAEDADLVHLESERFSFRPPLLRAAAYHAVGAAARREAHRAHADVLTAEPDRERRAWHLASAAVGPDEAVASALADAADAARARGGPGAAAEALERSARLTPDPSLRDARLGAAAHAAWEAGDAQHAAALVDEALATETDPAARARLAGLAGRIEFQSGDLTKAHALQLDAADALVALGDRTNAVTQLGVAALVLHNLARVDDAVALGRHALEVAEGEPEPVRMRAVYHIGRALQLAGRTDEAEPLLESVVEHLLSPEEPSRLALQRAAIALAVLGRPREALPLARRTLEIAQATGPMQVVYALSLVAQIELYVGDWARGTASATEGLVLCKDMGQENVAATFASFLVRVAGARGDAAALRRWEPVARAAVEASGNRFERLQLDHAIGLLALGEDRLDEAADRLAAVVDEAAGLGVLDRDLGAEPDLVEALVRSDRRKEAEAVLAHWIERGAPAARAWAPPLVERCRGLVGGDVAFLVRAVEDATSFGDPYALARTRLLLGEVLRRDGRRAEARRELTAAVEAFERLDADAWAERGRRELRASGATLRRGAEEGDELTPQELQVAQQVAEGKANKEVAAALFLSPKTVEFHLSRIYRKLGIGSRAELIVRFAGDGAATSSA